MNKVVAERSFLDTITVEKIDVSKTSINLDEFTRKINEASKNSYTEYIQLPNAQINIRANVRAVEKIIESSTKTIRIFSGGINRYIYGQPRIILKLYEWLLEDSNRQIKILLKKDADLMDTLFGTMMLELPRRLKFRVSLLEDIDQCFRNCIIGDDRILKLKEKNINTEEESAVVSFNDVESASKLIKLFESLFIDKYSKETILTTDFVIETKKSSTIDQKKNDFIQNTLHSFNNEIENKISINMPTQTV